MIGNLSRRYSQSKQPAKNDNLNYKELYLQCKKNVTLFMKHVDCELTNILKTHQEEKKRLRDQIALLKSQIKQQSHSSIASIKQPSTNKRSHSETKVNTLSSVSKETVEECLGKFNNINFKTVFSERKSQSEMMCAQKRNKLKYKEESEKQNFILPDNLTVDVQIDMKMVNSSRWDKRLRERKPLVATEKVDSIKDFLKDIRGKLTTKRPASQPKGGNQPMLDIITPGMFTARESK